MIRRCRKSRDEEREKRATSYTRSRILPEERNEIWDATMLTTLRQ